MTIIKYLLLRINDLFDEIVGVVIIYMINLRYGYHQVRVKETYITKIAFRTKYYHYALLVISFNLTNAPTIFINLVNRIFKLYADYFMILFIDDILIYLIKIILHI